MQPSSGSKPAGRTSIPSEFQAAVEANGAASATSGQLTVTTLTLTALDGAVAGDAFRIAVTRVANDGTNDTMTGDAELLMVELVEA